MTNAESRAPEGQLSPNAPPIAADFEQRSELKPQTDGLPDLQRYLAVPMLADDQTVAILGVANRDAVYGEDDRRAHAMADSVWRTASALACAELSLLQRTDVAPRA
jgi:GAF domain-containing protein